MRNLLPTFLVGVLLVGCGEELPKVEQTVDVNKKSIVQLLDTSLNKVTPAETDKVHFVVKNYFTSEFASPGNPREFVLGIGQTFYQFDHHSRMTFAVKEIRKSSVVINYESIFDHRSFGKNLITKDEGQIDLPFKY